MTALSNGTVNVTGTGSTWTNSGSLSVGSQGTGSLTISSHGTVSDTNGVVSGNGTVIVTGAGSAWNNSSELDIGKLGTGSLRIELGGTVSSNGTTADYVGFGAGSSGTVTITGTGSTWTSSSLVVGESGLGRLTISSGGVVSSISSVVGRLPDSDGGVTVTGTGSKWTNSGSLTIGYAQLGRMTISAGGAVTDTVGDIGHVGAETTGDGAVTVTGAGSTWTNTGNLFIGFSGTGALSIESGGAVSNAEGDIGVDAVTRIAGGSHGTVTITGTGSTWTCSSLAVGGVLTQSGGTGSLVVSSGGLVGVNGSTAVWAKGSIDVQSGGTFNAQDNLTIDAGVLTRASSGVVNLAANKTMTIQNGGRASFTGGYTTASGATYHVTGGRLETLSSSIVVGNGAQLNVDSGGTVSSATFLDVGTTGGDGTLLVAGNSSSATAAAPSLTFWASDGHIAHITFSNNATGSFPGGISLAPNRAPAQRLMSISNPART